MSSSAYVSPRKRAVEYMLQFCKEQGLMKTYETLVDEFATIQDHIELEANGGSIPYAALETAVDVYDTLMKTKETSESRQFSDSIQQILLRRSSQDPEINSMRLSIPSLHSSNIISVAACSTAISESADTDVVPENNSEKCDNTKVSASHLDIVATAAADRSIKVTSLATGEILATSTDVLPATGLCMEWNPFPHSANQEELLIGCLSGDVLLFTLKPNASKEDPTSSKLSLQLTHSWRPHSKYVIAVRWAADGKGFVTASHDSTVSFFKREVSPDTDDQFKEVAKKTFKGQVECLERLNLDESYDPKSDALKASTNSFICGVRDDHLLHVLDLETCSETDAINMNILGDEYVSFVPLSLSCSRNSMMLLVATDHHRVICYHLPSKKQVRNYYGARNDGFSTPRVTWVGNSVSRVAVTTQDNGIHIWDAETQQTINVLNAHPLRVRDLITNPQRSELITISLDKSLRVWNDSNLM